MKITLEFNEDETEAARDALDGYKWRLVVNELDNALRSTIKYDVSLIEDKPSETEHKLAEKYRELIRALVEEYNLSLD